MVAPNLHRQSHQNAGVSRLLCNFTAACDPGVTLAAGSTLVDSATADWGMQKLLAPKLEKKPNTTATGTAGALARDCSWACFLSQVRGTAAITH